MWLALRSLLWTVLFPGFVAGYAPWAYFGVRDVQPDLRHPVHLLGFLCIAVGVFGEILLTRSGTLYEQCTRRVGRWMPAIARDSKSTAR